MNIAEKLSSLVKFRTVSSFRPEEEDEKPFAALIEALPGLYPGAHAALERILVGPRGIVYRWQGKNPSLKPAIFCAHFDVVPASESDPWDEPPFSGTIRDGFVWGRGTQDIKVQIACILEAAETLLSAGFVPERTLYFAFGGDEEVGGRRGAGAISKWFSGQNVHASWVIDEGSPVGQGLVGFVQKPIALIGIAEKGYADIVIEVPGQGGHASMPPRNTALGALSHAIARIEDKPFPARITKTTDEFLAALAPHAVSPYKQIFSLRHLLTPVILKAFSATPSTNAMVRTTCAATMAQASPKENVLPNLAQAVINVRIMPGTTVAQVIDRFNALIAPYGAKAYAKFPEHTVEPSTESSTSSEGWNSIVAAISEAFPDAIPAPFLFTAGTDTKHYRGITDDIYRFQPLVQTQADLAAVHNVNEKVSVENLERCVRFYRALMNQQ
jgi:carboxypeptidase PM20D1